jgi:hypothetical protein
MLSVIVLMMEAVNTSEALVSFYQNVWRDIPRDSHIHENLINHQDKVNSAE